MIRELRLHRQRPCPKLLNKSDLADPAVVPALFDPAEAALGPVEILINNADAWLADTFLPDATDRLGRRLQPVTAASHDHGMRVNSRAAALLIAHLALRQTHPLTEARSGE